jgi:hypothetical protein
MTTSSIAGTLFFRIAQGGLVLGHVVLIVALHSTTTFIVTPLIQGRQNVKIRRLA